MAGLCLAKSFYAIPTWTKTVALVREHWALRRAFGCEGDPPSIYATHREAAKAWRDGRAASTGVKGLRDKLADYGRDIAIDASDMPATRMARATPTGAGPFVCLDPPNLDDSPMQIKTPRNPNR